MEAIVGTFRLFVTAICLFCINLVALADETPLPANWNDYGKLATFANGERNNNEDIVLSTVDDRTTYTIYTTRGLAWVAYATNNGMTGDGYPASAGFEGCTVELGNDLSLALPTGFPIGFASWTPIGTSDKPFLGTFDGKYKAISGLKVTGVESAGLFGYVGNSASGKKGNISNIGINGANVTGLKYAGALVGCLYGTMERCWSSGSVTTGTFIAEAGGGLVGEATDGSVISNCYSTATVKAPLAGGVVGSLDGKFEYCYATGKVASAGSPSSDSGASGGICGKLNTSTDVIINNNFAFNKDGIVAQTQENAVGRIIGISNGSGIITLIDNYASVLIAGEWSETDINGGACTYDKLVLLCQDNEVFKSEEGYLPKLTGFEDNQPALVAYDYVGGGEISKGIANGTLEFVDKTVSSAVYGETVKFTVTPESEWYFIDNVKVNKVTDDNGTLGGEVRLNQPNGKYSFVMPETPVKITVNIDAIDTWEEYAEGAVSCTDYIKDGTTYTIKTARGLAWVAYVTSNRRTSSDGDAYPGRAYFEGYTIKLANDISITQPEGAPDGWATWTPIGTSAKPFLGTFDGNNHVVSNLTVSGVESAGLFGCVGKHTNNEDKKGEIINLGVDGANVTGTTYAGVIAGQLYGTMEKCWSSGSVKVPGTGAEAGGGLVGTAIDGSTISNCYSTATVTAPLAGGVVGSLIGTLEYCYATGKVISARSATTGGFYNPTYGPAGGICGIVSNVANINNCIAMNADGITGGTTGRIWGEGSITGSSNYASTKISGTWTSDAAGKDGKDVVYSEYISYVKNNWSQDVWTISNKNLPQLKDMSGQTALPRADYMEVAFVAITITPPSRGRIEVYEDGEKQEPDGENKIAAAIGSTVTIKAIANDDYGISWLKINDELQQGATVDNYLISNDITISASFYFVIPDVFMSNGICYERLSDSSEEVAVRKLISSGADNYYNGDLDLQEKVVYSNDYDQAEFRLTAIADEAFEGSSDLKSVALPPVIASIGSNAFKGCTGLEKLVVKSPSSVTQSATEPAVPTAGEYAFDDICETAVLYVPEGWKEAFKAASEWNKFFSIKEQREDGTVLAELTITASSGGTLSVGSITSENDTKTVKVVEGTDVIVEVAAAEGYVLSSLTCNGNDVIDQLVDDKLTLSAINGENSISALFIIDTGIAGIGTSGQKVSVKDGAIVIDGVAKGEVVCIYNALGNLLHRKVANGEPLEIPMAAGQVYILKIGKQSFKVMFWLCQLSVVFSILGVKGLCSIWSQGDVPLRFAIGLLVQRFH